MISVASAVFIGWPMPGIREISDPAKRKRVLAFNGDFQRHLIGGTTDAAGLGLDARLGVVHGALEDLDRVAGRVLFPRLESNAP